MGLHRACTQGRRAEVRRLIQDGHDVNAYDKSGWTPLLIVAYCGHVEVARELVRASADVHLKVKGSGRTVLHVAAYYIYQVWFKFVYLLMMFISRMDDQAAREMVRAKADNYWKIKVSCRTALHIAAYYGHQALVKLFLKTNININEQDDEGRTALMLAVERGHSAVVAELVKAGADISLKDKNGMTAVLLVKTNGVAHQLVKNVGHHSREDRSRILWHACDVGDLSTVQSVIEAGCDVDHVHKGQTPVMMATLRGHDSIVKELILANCDVNLHSKVYYSDLASSLKIARLIWSMAFLWLVIVSGDWIPRPSPNLGVPVLRTDALQTFMLALALSVMAVVGVLLVPGSGSLMLLGTGVVAMAMFWVVRVMMMEGSMVFVVFVALVVTVLLVMTSMYREFFKIIAAAVVLCTCAHVVQFMMLMNFVLSQRDVAMVGVTIVIVIVALKCLLQRRMMAALQKLVVTVLVGASANVELIIISLVCARFQSAMFVHHECLPAKKLVDLFSILLFTGIALLVRTQNTVVASFRGAVVLFGFQVTRMYNMENYTLAALDDTPLGLILLVLVVARNFADALAAKKSVLLKGVVLLLHLVVAVAEVCLVILLSNIYKERVHLHNWATGIGLYMNVIVVMTMMTPIKAANVTALHYAAGHNTIKCGVLLVEAGGDVRAKNKRFCTPFEIGSTTFQYELKQMLSFTTKHVIAVIGNTEHGKSTLVAALEHTSSSLWKKAINHFKKVHDIRRRTAGIEAVQVSNQKYGEALFYDFAGQSQYHGPHQSFLEAMMSKPEVSVTLLLLVKATEEEDVITQQLYRWLQPLALISIPITSQVVVVGSFLDQVESQKEASEKLLRCTQSVKAELPLDIQSPCLLDCRQPESRGIDQICSFLQEAHPVNTGALSYNLHWVLVQVRKAFSIPALQLHEFQIWLQDNARKLANNLPSPEEVCQDLSAAGHTFYLPNKQDLSQSWLILDLPALLHDVYGTLFSGSQGTVNQFGLLHCSQLAELFPEMVPEVIQEVLISLEFCIEIDPAILEEELLQLAMDKGREGWLYFPALVFAQPCKVFPEDPGSEQFQWMCWQLRTVTKHFISAHLLQTIILRLAANHVFTHKLSPSVRKHCCKVWVNGISWRSTKGVDIAVQISDSNVVQVLGRSQAGSEKLHQYTSTVVRDVIKTTTQLSPKLEATPYIVHPYTPTVWEDPKAAWLDSLYPVSSITRCISEHDEYVLSMPPGDGAHPQQMSLLKLFGWSPSLSVVQDMDCAERPNSTGPSRDPLNPLLSAPTLDELNQLVVWRVAVQWYEVGVFLEVGAAVLNIIKANHSGDVERACKDVFLRWLSREPGTGDQRRVWLFVLEAVKETVGKNVAEEVERQINNHSS